VQLTKYSHSCVRLEDGDRALVLDPGVFSEVDAALDGADAVLVTHEHPDHVDAERLRAAAERDDQLRIWAPQPVAEMLGLAERVTVVTPGQALDVAGFGIRTFGGQHAIIHPTIPVVANVGYLIDEAVYHPGDSLIVPPLSVELLLAPISAPWSKVAEVIDFVVAVRAPRVVGIHDALLTDVGRQIVEGHVERIGGEHGSRYVGLRPLDTTQI
jgi:L-ascorbate metabolism protein UlaG (beta-lactamase superfamily)